MGNFAEGNQIWSSEPIEPAKLLSAVPPPLRSSNRACTDLPFLPLPPPLLQVIVQSLKAAFHRFRGWQNERREGRPACCQRRCHHHGRLILNRGGEQWEHNATAALKISLSFNKRKSAKGGSGGGGGPFSGPNDVNCSLTSPRRERGRTFRPNDQKQSGGRML